MAENLVSIIIPSYNRAYVLGETLESVLEQTYPHYEAIVIDDGSSDNTEELVQQFIARDQRIKYIKQKNGGVSSARNHGMLQAQGNLLAFLDSDDLWYPWKLELQVKLMDLLPDCVMLWSDMEAIDAQGKFLAPRYLRKMYGAYKNHDDTYPFNSAKKLSEYLEVIPEGVPADTRISQGDIFIQMLNGNLVHTSTVMFRRRRIEEAELFLEKYRHAGEDFHFHLLSSRLGSAAYMDISTIKYRLGLEDRITHPRNKLIFALAYLDTVKPFLNDPRVSPEQSREILATSSQWIGEQLLDNNQRVQALQYFVSNLKEPKHRSEAIKMIIKTFLPMNLIRKLLGKKKPDCHAAMTS